MLLLLGIVGAIGLITGAFATTLADRFPRYRAALRDWGGSLLVGSAALLGLAFPMI